MNLKFTHIYVPALAVIWLGLFLDSTYTAQHIAYGQTITNIIVILVFAWLFFHASKITKQLMLFCVVVSYVGEVILSLGFGMYIYRLGNVPLYVPFGHAIVYAGVYYMTKEPWVRLHQQRIISILYPAIIIYSTLWLILANDVYGFFCTLIILLLFKHLPNTKLFFLLMFFMVVYLELLGTFYQSWFWPSIWFDVFSWMPSANPPSGIGVVYFVLDAACLFLYQLFHGQSWQRFRRAQKISNK